MLSKVQAPIVDEASDEGLAAAFPDTVQTDLRAIPAFAINLNLGCMDHRQLTSFAVATAQKTKRALLNIQGALCSSRLRSAVERLS